MNLKYKHSNVIKLIKQRQLESGMTEADLSRAIGLSKNAFHKMMQSESCTVERLHELSIALNYNLFQALANQLPIANPQNEKTAELEAENRALIKVLRTPVE